jgi:hypothetical protein
MMPSQSRIVTGSDSENILPQRAFVYDSSALYPAHDPFRSQRFSTEGASGCLPDQEKKQNQGQIQEQKTKDLEGTSRQT